MIEAKARRQREIENLRRKILDTALWLAEEGGWANVTIRKIAARIEYTPPVIYHYFKNKEDIHYNLSVRGSLMLKKKIGAILSSESDPKAALMRLAREYWDWAFENRALYAIMFHMPQVKLDEELIRQNREALMSLFRKIDPECDERVLATRQQSFHCLVHGYVSLVMNKRVIIADVEQSKKMMETSIENFLKRV